MDLGRKGREMHEMTYDISPFPPLRCRPDHLHLPVGAVRARPRAAPHAQQDHLGFRHTLRGMYFLRLWISAAHSTPTTPGSKTLSFSEPLI